MVWSNYWQDINLSSYQIINHISFNVFVDCGSRGLLVLFDLSWLGLMKHIQVSYYCHKIHKVRLVFDKLFIKEGVMISMTFIAITIYPQWLVGDCDIKNYETGVNQTQCLTAKTI